MEQQQEPNESYWPRIQAFSPRRFPSTAPTNLHGTARCKCYGDKT